MISSSSFMHAFIGLLACGCVFVVLVGYANDFIRSLAKFRFLCMPLAVEQLEVDHVR